MSIPPLPPDAQQALDGYTEQLTELVDACSAALKHDQEFFLWNARRADEVVCLILLTVHERSPVTSDPDGKDGLQTLEALYQRVSQARREEDRDPPTSPTTPGDKKTRRPKLVGQDFLNLIDQIRKNSNPGVHVRAPHRVKLDHLLDNVDRALAHLVRWLFRESDARHYLTMNDVLSLALEELQRGGREGPPPHVHVKELRAKLEEKKVELATEQLQRKALEKELAKASRARGGRLAAGSVGAVLGVLLATLVFVGLVGFERSGSSTATPPVVAAAAPATQTGEVVVAPPAPVQVALSCPEGMVRIEPTRLHIGQPRPSRAGWPPASPAEVKPFEVPAFCIDARAVRWGEIEGSPADGARNGACARHTTGLTESSPAVCVLRDEARSYCQGREHGDLPTLAQWEAVARADNRAAVQDDVENEWIQDDFPPSVLNRKLAAGQSITDGMFRTKLKGSVDPDGNLLWSWNHQKLDSRLGIIGFRCAVSGP